MFASTGCLSFGFFGWPHLLCEFRPQIHEGQSSGYQFSGQALSYLHPSLRQSSFLTPSLCDVGQHSPPPVHLLRVLICLSLSTWFLPVSVKGRSHLVLGYNWWLSPVFFYLNWFPDIFWFLRRFLTFLANLPKRLQRLGARVCLPMFTHTQQF